MVGDLVAVFILARSEAASLQMHNRLPAQHLMKPLRTDARTLEVVRALLARRHTANPLVAERDVLHRLDVAVFRW